MSGAQITVVSHCCPDSCSVVSEFFCNHNVTEYWLRKNYKIKLLRDHSGDKQEDLVSNRISLLQIAGSIVCDDIFVNLVVVFFVVLFIIRVVI